MWSLMLRIVVKVGVQQSSTALSVRLGARIATRSCCSPAGKTKRRYGSMSKRDSTDMISRRSSQSPRALTPRSSAGVKDKAPSSYGNARGAQALDHMQHYRLSKYDPSSRDISGAYLVDEWTSRSDIGQS